MGTPNWQNQTIWTGDNLPIMRGMNSECVDLIYLDPPFNSNHDYAAPIGSEAAGAAFKDTWSLSDIDIAWVDLIEAKHPQLAKVIHASMRKSDKSYMIYMAVRLIEMKRLLKPTGSIYLHCNQFASHYLKLVMDAIFGRSNFINEIIWNYGTPSGGRAGGGGKPVKVHDCLLVYAGNYGKHVYNRQYTPYSDKYINQWFRHIDENGRAYRTRSRKGEIIRQYLDESKGMPLSTVWSDIMQLSSRRGWFPGTKGEETGYPTQKPLALLDRIIKASSNDGDVVFDAFCGCATTLVSADRLERQWIGIDISELAVKLVARRIEDDQGFYPNVIARSDIPARDDLEDLPPYTSLAIKNALYGEQGGDCNGCGTHFEKRHLEVDHITARKQGGIDHIGNLQLLCGSCNRIKGGRGMEYLITKLAA
ncbi:MAG: DNA methyltransferase [Gammaproteobacteria bacterium]|nr:DNA methyltransferase [Gammaproteobacteria bacterium]